MKQLDFSSRSLVDRYYRERFVRDLGNYFVIHGWKANGRNNDRFTQIKNLYTRGFNPIDGSPAIYMGCGPDAREEENYLFSGIFAYMYLATKCIYRHCGFDQGQRFCMTFNFPSWINDHQTNEDFDVVATLKEAGLAQCRDEARNYLSMLDLVIPYMKDITGEFLQGYDPDVLQELDLRIEDLRSWVRETKDEILSFYGLGVRKEYMTEGSECPARYYLLEPLSRFWKRHGIRYFIDIPELGLERAPFSYGDITEFDGPVIPHYEDFDYMCEYLKTDSTVQPRKTFRKMTEEEEMENNLFNTLLNLCWQDEPYRKGGLTGLKDCWGRVLVPAEYEDCQGIDNNRFLDNDSICVLVRRYGKWAFVERKFYKKRLTDFVFDGANLIFQGYYVTRIGDRYGLFSQSGYEILPTTMEDIYDPTVCTHHIMYKQDGRYGIRFCDGTMTTQLLDEVTTGTGRFLSVRVGNDWGYLDKEGNFVRERQHAFIEENGFNFNSMAIYECGFPTDIDEENMISFEDMMARLKRNSHRFSIGMDLYGSILQGKAEIRMGLGRLVLYYTHEGSTFCVDMQKPYMLKLVDDRYHDMELSWKGHTKSRELLKAWLNGHNAKTGVRNWAELVYEFSIHPHNENRPLSVSYAFRKKFDIRQVPLCDFEKFDFPEIEFMDQTVRQKASRQ